MNQRLSAIAPSKNRRLISQPFFSAAITMQASSHPEFAPASAPGTAALVPRLPRTVVGLHSHLLRNDQVEQLLRFGGIEHFQVLVRI